MSPPGPPHRNKRSIAVTLKSPKGVEVVRRLCSQADVIIEPYRPGVMENLGLGPNVLMESNPRLVYARLTGFGQTGPLSHRAGHDINYLATAGLLSVSHSTLGYSSQDFDLSISCDRPCQELQIASHSFAFSEVMASQK